MIGEWITVILTILVAGLLLFSSLEEQDENVKLRRQMRQMKEEANMNTLMRMYQKQVKGYSPTQEFTKEMEGNMRKYKVTLHIDDIEIKTTERSQNMKTLANEHYDLWQHFDFVSIEEVKA